MSEPSSLYARVRLSEVAFAAFEASAAALPSQYTDWLAWLATQHYHGAISQAEIDKMEYGDKASSAGDEINLWLNAPYLNMGHSHFDAETQTWTLGLLDCSENYKDFILILSILRGVAQYKDLPGEDFILIFPFFWGGPPEAYVVVTAGSSSLVTEIPQAVEAEATAQLEKIYQILQSAFSDQEL